MLVITANNLGNGVVCHSSCIYIVLLRVGCLRNSIRENRVLIDIHWKAVAGVVGVWRISHQVKKCCTLYWRRLRRMNLGGIGIDELV